MHFCEKITIYATEMIRKGTICLATALLLCAMTLPGVSAQQRSSILIRAQFQDLPLSSTQEQTEALAERCEQYFDSQFGTAGDFLFDIGPIVDLAHGYAYYGANDGTGPDVRIHEAVSEACKAADQEVDFSQYSDIIVLFSGPGENYGAGLDYIWPRQGALDCTLDGRTFNHFACIVEESPYGICKDAGMLCHEFAHLLGLPDLYDTDGEESGGTCKALWGSTALMDNGFANLEGWTPAGFNAIDRRLLGIGQADTLKPGHHILEPIDKGGRYLVLARDGETFVFECRDSAGWDKGIGGAGLAIYHLDNSRRDAGFSTWHGALTAAQRWEVGQINCNPDHPCAYLVEALEDAEDASGVFWPQPQKDCFGSDSAPSFRWWDGQPSGLALTDISRNQDTGAVEFDVLEPLKITCVDAFQDAARLEWKVGDPFRDGRECRLSLICGADTLATDAVLPVTDSLFTIRLDGLYPSTEYRVHVGIDWKNGDTFSCEDGFRTKAFQSGSYPFIHLKGAERNPDGSFPCGSAVPLVVDNAPGAEVCWFFDGEPVSTGPDGLFHLENSGTLRAEIPDDQGGKNIIIKEVTVK